jgi:endogenous inhibitor of DNA gyrase (YacG/DUF329 family)
MKKSVKMKCPTCKREGDWFPGPFGPFCSRQCKLIDLGKWFQEEHTISEPLTGEDLEEMHTASTDPNSPESSLL